jgi:hypothetical protein
MYIYKIINKQNGRWYIGKTNGQDPNYMGSGKLLKQAYAKYGKQNFEKIVLEICSSLEELNQREQHWITESGALSDPLSYNLAEGGSGGDLSKFIPYDKIDYSNHKMQGTKAWFHNLTKEQQKEFHARQAAKRTKGWYVSRVDDPTEIYVDNISKWCEEHGVDKSMPTALNNPNSHLFQKQTKGWRIRRSDMPELLPYQNNRNVSRPNDACRGKSWKLEGGKRVWYDKYNIVEG